ncbi:WXG100 family type VII secretion target [Dactylosporangium sp. NPDC048998]|uniref:WXG100 family type VII secretion target n=1 Tax=Dactylosporangium sp. NPDC048998 TaxID=3363976 RepID=UPI00371CF9C4
MPAVRTEAGGGSMPVPPYYGDQSLVIRVDPDGMFVTMNQALVLYGQGVADSIKRIIDIWNNLKLGWVGDTADEAKAFNDAWATAMINLFGTDENPDVGILTHIADAVILASINYGEAEDSVNKMFQQMSTSMIAGRVAGGLGAHGDPSRHLNDGPITENT